MADNAHTPIIDHLDLWSSIYVRTASTGRGGNGKIASYGIQKLRELILELAVRGKLVPQDPNDEPASEFLKKVFVARDALVEARRIKKSLAVKRSSSQKMEFDLPIGWAWASLSQLGVFAGGKTPSKANKAYWGGSIPWVTPKDMKTDEVVDSEDHVTESAINNGLALYQPESILFVVRSGILRRTFPVAVSKVEFTVNQDLKVLTPYLTATSHYVALMMRGFTRYILDNLKKTGMTVESIIFNEFSSHAFPLPPLAEQNRIVAKVDELMVLCDQLERQQTDSHQAHQALVETLLRTLVDAGSTESTQQAWNHIAEHFDTLFATEESIDQLKQTILQLAVMGKLVPQNENDEPVGDLLGRISHRISKVRKRPERQAKKTTATPWNEERLPNIPKEWKWVHLGELITMMDAGWSPACSPEPSPNDDVWGVLKTTAVQVMTYLEEENKRLPDAKQPRPGYEVRKGDILITRAGPKNRVAISCLVENTRPKLMISDKIIRFHLVGAGVHERYISLCLNAGATADYLEKAKSGMAESQMNISQDKLKSSPIPLCPTNEQHRIVSKVDEFMALCDTLKARIQEAQTTQVHLADAVVEQAVA